MNYDDDQGGPEKLPVPASDAGPLAESLAALKSIPGAVKTIAHVVTGTGEAAIAWTDVVKAARERKAQAIRDETAAKSAFTKMIAKAARRKPCRIPHSLIVRSGIFLQHWSASKRLARILRF